jgi:hypothetical protein
MNPLALSAAIFILVTGGILAGALLRSALPHHHLSKDSQDVVRLGVGLIATMAALVVGLLIAAAKGSFDTQSGQVKQITADIIQIDNLMEQYGPEASSIRTQIRVAIGPFADRIWGEKETIATGPYQPNVAAEKIYLAIQSLSPKNDLQRSLQSRAVQITNDLVQTRLLLFTEADNAIPFPFLCVLTFWLFVIFASFSLFSALNATVFVALSLFALSASCAIYLILQLSDPFSGLLMISSAPLRNALAPLGQ